MDKNSSDLDQDVLEPKIIVLRVSNLFMINYNYLVVDHVGKSSVIIDPAWDMDKIEQAIEESQTSLRGILLTHSHPDHLDLAMPLADKYNCPIWMSREEIAISRFSAPQLVVSDKLPWLVGGLKIQPILTPGHTPGSICYLIGDNLFTGDTLFAEGCGICPDVPAAHAMYESLKDLKDRIKEQTRIFPGHNYGKPPGQQFSFLLRNNIYLQFKNKDDFASYRLRKGQDRAKFFEFY